MNVTHKIVDTIYKMLYKIKQLSHVILKKLTLKLSTKATALGHLQQATCVENRWDGERILCAFLYKW